MGERQRVERGGRERREMGKEGVTEDLDLGPLVAAFVGVWHDLAPFECGLLLSLSHADDIVLYKHTGISRVE